ncbi:hypothetical protein D0864_11107 [Hortaea werneckii]|uniref:CS domain-containing protein n=1 Tax=Hortaea werneckii TaxID=91943 RepID=A0A3M7EG26_HORWE|nr:hypothetical protein KC338_g9160 [Hortaea werneckii]KAI6858077.1 hypothetical protein KC323_g7148 [Hortaea werneckii]KAI7350818.1 hypothetical protein KC320_g5342 [Hortaea werneckii]RMY69433.1 hypothetical protein D0864_11107 [Hortaea werneckii]RMY71094.1 hypothetical protein D0862_14653 [Hortaea werneckii]
MEVPKNTTDTAFAGKVLTPEVTWAQRSSATEAEKNHIFLTIAVPDVDPKKIKLDVQPTHVDFSGYSETKKAQYAVKLDFYAEIDPAATKIHHTQRDIEMVVQKKQLGEEYWPRLLKDKAKVHFLKTDFNKWVDEDEQDAVPEDDDYMSRMAGMQGMGGDGGFGGIDFSKLGGMGGADMAGLQGMQGMGGEGDDDEGDDDDEEGMPALEGEDDAKAGSKAGKKVEEVE